MHLPRAQEKGTFRSVAGHCTAVVLRDGYGPFSFPCPPDHIDLVPARTGGFAPAAHRVTTIPVCGRLPRRTRVAGQSTSQYW
ncbi:hypothetical protein GCM10010282_15300 [Streptomyces roseolus]|nr:hypothetical protein GCM10010282_15300 [Streptomyces roseolus]